VDAGEIPGAVLLAARDNKIVWHEAVGYLDREAGTPMRTDAIFRVASMTKPLTSLAIPHGTTWGSRRRPPRTDRDLD
jgi:CubicO group peptidase (beta-lactamase class C family)